jgi:hypothetical protein
MPSKNPPPSAAILQFITNMWATQSVATFARLGMADVLASGPQPASVVAERTGANPDATYRLLRGVAAVGVVEALPKRRFALTPLGEVLRGDVPGSMRSFIIAETAPGHWLPWGHMEHSVRTGKPATFTTLGKDAWDYYAENPEEARQFAQSMSGLSAMAIEAILDVYSFEGAKLLVDVGGSHGSLLAAVLKTVPKAKGILFDLPHVIEGAPPHLERAGVAKRVTRVAGSFFDSVPAGGDTYLLKLILHDWNDDECVKILGCCKNAMAPGAKVVVLDMLITDKGPPGPAPFMDLNMLVMHTGRERTAEEFAGLYARAGLKLDKVVLTASPFAVIVGRAA